MKIYSTNRINALGLKGPEETPQEIENFMKYPVEKIKVDNDNIQESENILYMKAKEIFNKNEKQVFIGGDHSITYPIFKAFQEKNKNSFLIIFDAHVDCDFCANEPTHEEWLRGVIEAGFNPKNIILIGARKMWDVEKKFLAENEIKVFNGMFDIESATDYITEMANGKELYVSIDIDVLDPAFAPAVNYPEPAGLNSKEFFYILKRILKVKSLKTMDIVEIVPQKDKNSDNLTLRTVAKIIEEVKTSLD